MFERRVALIHAPFSGGAGIPGCELAPSVLQMSGLNPRLRDSGLWISDLHPDLGACGPVGKANLDQVVKACQQVKRAMAEALRTDVLPVLLGGDHSLSIGSVAAVSEFCLQRKQPLWVLWFDAHADFNTTDTSPSGNAHGMPAAAICGAGAPELLSLSTQRPMVDPKQVSLVGVRSMDAEEATRVENSTVELFTLEEVRRRGLNNLVNALLERVAASNGHLHVSLDVDVMDPLVAPGVGTPEANGIGTDEMLQCLQRIGESGLLDSLDVMEFNPRHDRCGITARLLIQLLETLLDQRLAAMSTGAVKLGGGV